MLKGGDTLGRYRIVDLIGSGGMGEVYLAEDTELQRRVAVKLFTRELPAGGARDHLLHEARAASALSHPNVCTVFEVGESEGRPYIVMEYVEGRTLDTLIARRDLPTERVVRYGSQIADAVAHAHQHGVVHRDLKSANIVITNDGRAKVLDFGLASTMAAESEDATRDVTSAEVGRISGTLSHMAPEVLRGQEADARSDIWALGVILYEATTGDLPFVGDTAFEVSTAIMKDSAEVPAETSPGLKAVIQRCLQKAPGERYQSAAEVRAALEMLQSGGATSNEAISAEVAAAARSAAGPNWTAIAATFSVISVVALAAWVGFGQLATRLDTGDPAGGATTTPDAENSGAAIGGPAIGASGRPTIAVLPFRDRTGSDEMAWLAEGVPSMLLTSLAQTRGLDVVSNTRVQEIVSQLGAASLQDLDAAALAEFAARSGAGAVVVGDLYYTGTDYRFDVQVEDVNEGRVLNAYSATGPFIFALVDDLAAQIRAGLELDAAPSAASIADVTTDSLEAWRAYDQGLAFLTNARGVEAVAAFEEAVRLDPDFAMARFHLGRLPLRLADPSLAAEHDAFVLANMDRIPQRDRLYVEGEFALDHDNDPERAALLLEELVGRYPDHENGWIRLTAARRQPGQPFTDLQIETLERGIEAMPTSGILHNQLGYAMLSRGRYAEAVRAIERYIELNPEEANAYDSLAEIYTVSGQPAMGLEKYTESLDVDPAFVSGYFGRAATLAMLGRYDEALEELDIAQEAHLQVSPSPFSTYPLAKGMLLSKLGRYDEAMELFSDPPPGFAAAGAEVLMSGGLLPIHFALEAEDLATARELIAASRAIASNADDPAVGDLLIAGRTLEGLVEVRAGNLAAARRIRSELGDEPRESMYDVFGTELLGAEIALADGDLEEAETLFRATEPELKAFYSRSVPPPTLILNNHLFRDGVARVKVAQGDLAAAIRIYRELITVNLGSKYTSFVDPRYVLRLAELLDEAGQTEEAGEQYLRFAELWNDADPQFQPVVEQARARGNELSR